MGGPEEVKQTICAMRVSVCACVRVHVASTERYLQTFKDFLDDGKDQD